MVTLKKNDLTISVAEHGAELKSLKKGDREYMWQADPTFWGRTSPVLFPFVGAVNNKTYRVNGVAYSMGQHGFARDMDFALLEQQNDSVKYVLKSDAETRLKYPYDFELTIGYELTDMGVRVTWQVKNTGADIMHFSIGAHPAFNCTFEDSYLEIKKTGKQLMQFDNTVFGAGVLTAAHRDVELPEGKLSYREHTFDGDAYVLENGQADTVTLYDRGEKRIEVSFTAPLLGIWAPVGKPAPFVCIEPWYGCADTEGFAGDISERKWGQKLAPQEIFTTEYTISCF